MLETIPANLEVVYGIAPLLLGLLAGAGLGLAKHVTTDAPIAEKQRKVQGATTRYSPWTGMRAPEPSQPNAFGSMMQGGLAGAQFGALGAKAGLFGGGANPGDVVGMGAGAGGAPGGMMSAGRMMPGMAMRMPAKANPWDVGGDW